MMIVLGFEKEPKRGTTCQFDDLRNTSAVWFMFPPMVFLASFAAIENPFAAKTSLQSAFL